MVIFFSETGEGSKVTNSSSIIIYVLKLKNLYIQIEKMNAIYVHEAPTGKLSTRNDPPSL